MVSDHDHETVNAPGASQNTLAFFVLPLQIQLPEENVPFNKINETSKLKLN